MALFRKGSKESKELKTHKEKIRDFTLRKLSSIYKRLRSKKAKVEFKALLREFFAAYFHIKYEFTYNELKQELEKKKIKHEIRIDLDLLIDSIAKLEYSKDNASIKEFQNLCKQAIKIFKQL